jgi:hypothetical protein
MILIYKTTVQNRDEADSITELILNEIPSCDISFDLDDCDHVLRIESKNGKIDEHVIYRIFRKQNHNLEVLPI